MNIMSTASVAIMREITGAPRLESGLRTIKYIPTAIAPPTRKERGSDSYGLILFMLSSAKPV